MEIKLDQLENCKFLVKAMYDDSLEIERKKNKIISKYRNVKVPGFRQGKADDNSIFVSFRKQIEDDLKNELASECYEEAVNLHKLKPITLPQFSKADLGFASFNCEFILLTKPEFELKQYKFEVPKPDIKPSAEERAQSILEEIRFQYGERNPFSDTDTAQLGDSLVLNYSGKDNVTKESIQELQAVNEVYELGKGPTKEFEDNLIGMKVGETKEFTIDVYDKKIDINVTLLMGTKITPIGLNDELAKKAANVETFTELMEKINALSSNKYKEEYNKSLSTQIFKKLIDANEIQMPDWLKLAEARIMATQNKLDWDSIDDSQKENYLLLAESNIKFSLILEAIREKEAEAQLSDSEAMNLLKNWVIKSNNGNVNEFVNKLETSGQLPIFINRIKDEFTIEFLIKNTTIIE